MPPQISADFGDRLGSIYKILGDFVCGCFLGDRAGKQRSGGTDGDVVSGPAQTGSEETRARVELKPPELDDIPLEQSRDEMLKNMYDWVRTIDGQPLQPDKPLSYPYFSLIKDRLYWVTQDT